MERQNPLDESISFLVNYLSLCSTDGNFIDPFLSYNSWDLYAYNSLTYAGFYIYYFSAGKNSNSLYMLIGFITQLS